LFSIGIKRSGKSGIAESRSTYSSRCCIKHAERQVAIVAEISWVDGGWVTATAYTAASPRQALKHNGASYICILGHTWQCRQYK
jgi:hypothetical protein